MYVFGAVLLLALQMPMPVSVSPPMRAVQPNEGISVRGNGSATAPASTATLSLYVSSRNNAIVLNESTLSPIVDALVRAGVQRSDIVLPIYLTGNARTNNVTVTATVHHPSIAMLQNGIAGLGSSLTNSPDLIVNNAQVRLTLDDCTPTMQQAQIAALRQAHANAASIARQMGLHLGAVLAVDAQNMQMDAEGRCLSEYTLGPYQGNQFTSPSDYLTVRITTSVSVRYAIR